MFNKKSTIALMKIKGIGIATARAVIDKCDGKTVDSANDLLDAIQMCGKLKKSSPNITDCKTALEEASKIIDNSEKHGIKIIVYNDKDFPDKLLETTDESGKSRVPIILYCKGDTALLKQRGVAIIGTRNPTPEGASVAFRSGEFFAKHKYNIVSGLALGCDTEGHKGALHMDGKTTALLAHGLDTVYPPQNKGLAQDIVSSGGLLVSEYALGENVTRYTLVDRDRLQAALGSATIVIQTGVKGGTMHAANITFLMNKPLYCIKYSDSKKIPNDKISGNNKLVMENKAKFISIGDFNSVKSEIELFDHNESSKKKLYTKTLLDICK